MRRSSRKPKPRPTSTAPAGPSAPDASVSTLPPEVPTPVENQPPVDPPPPAPADDEHAAPLAGPPASSGSEPDPVRADETWFRAGGGEPPAEIDARWRREVYRGDVPQLTPRALLTGSLLGGLMALSNLFVGLKAGWSMGVALTACLLSYSVWRLFARAGMGRPLSLLENNCMQSTASAAGFSTGSILVTAVPAYLLITGVHIQPIWLVLWTFFLATLGLMMAIPLKRALIHYEQLKFPTGFATAQMLHSLHRRGRETMRQARVLFGCMGVGALVQWSITNRFSWWKLPRIPETFPFAGSLAGRPLADYTVGLDGSLVYAAAGAILGVRVCAWMVVGSTLTYLVIAPWLFARGGLEEISYGSIQVGFSLWTGASMMVSASLVALLFQRDTLARALGSLQTLLRRSRSGREEARDDPLADVELPSSWFWGGSMACAAGVLIVGHVAFAMPWWLSAGAVLLSMVFVLVTCRAMGETDIAPVGALGKIAQLKSGILLPGSLTSNLMSASIATTSAASAADLMVRQKCGYLLGAHPRRQFLAQFAGVVVGTAVVVPAFYVLVPHADRLGTPTFPAPAAQAWRFVAQIMASGLDALSTPARWGLVAGTLLGAILAWLEHRREGRSSWVPSPVGLGMGMVIYFSNALSFFLGAVVVAAARRRWRKSADPLVLPAASGLIAGESLMGILLAALVALGWMPA